MFPICKSNNNIFFLDAKKVTSLDIIITDFYINGIKYVHYSFLKVFMAYDLRDTTLFLRLYWSKSLF